MKKKLLQCKLIVFLLFSFLLLSFSSSAQTLSKQANRAITGTTSGGYLEWLPAGYSTSTKYPLIIYFHGLGVNGSGSDADLNVMLNAGSGSPVDVQKSGNWPDVFTNPADGQPYRFVMIYPQFPVNLYVSPPSEVDKIIDFAVANYSIDTTRIYLMGHSNGAAAPWEYARHSSHNANRVAAIMPFSAPSFPWFKDSVRIMRYAYLPIWAFHNLNDNPPNGVEYSFTQRYVQYYNETPAPSFAPTAKLTADPGPQAPNAHNSWTGPLSMQPISGEAPGSPNVYQWLLQYTRPHKTVFAGEDQELYLPTNSTTLNGQGTGPNGTVASRSWTKIFGPPTYTISDATAMSPTISNLLQGNYIFRLTLTDNASQSYTDDVAVTVNPAFTRYEAESYTAATPGGHTVPPDFPGVVTTSTADIPNGIKVDGIGRSTSQGNDYMDYNVAVPTTGSYTFRLRAGDGTGGVSLKIKDNSGTILDTVHLYATGYDDYLNFFAFNVNLVAGPQTIRIQNGDIVGAEGRSWFLNYFDVSPNFGSQNAPLPVRFSQFNVRCNNSNTELTWKTATEINTKEFRIEKSTNGSAWTLSSTLPASGQTSAEVSYSYRDVAATGNSLYRVVAVDFDGKQTISSAIRSQCGGKSSLAAFPNPVKSSATVSLFLEQPATVRLSLFDMKGALVREAAYQLQQGTTQVPFGLEGLKTGAYTLKASWGEEIKTIRLVKE